MKRAKTVSVVLLAVALSACGGGDEDSPNGTNASFTAYGEAQRVVALWRGLRDMAAIVFPYAHDAASLAALGGTSVNCLSGGTVGYVYTPDPHHSENTLQITYQDCAEALGMIDGTMTLFWGDSEDRPDLNRFEPAWFADISVDGAIYTILRPSVISTTYNTVSGLQQTYIAVKSTSALQGFSGPAVEIGSFRETVSYTPGDATASITSTLIVFSNFPAGAFGKIQDNGAIVAQIVASGDGILGVATPQTAGFVYSRGGRIDDLEPVTGSATTSAGMLTMDVQGNSSHTSLTETFAWPSIIDAPDYDMRD